MKIAKRFELIGMDLTAYVNVFNLFNHLDENSVHSITGHAGPNAYLPEEGRLREQRIIQNGVFSLDEADYNPSWYSRPRFIQFGLDVGF